MDWSVQIAIQITKIEIVVRLRKPCSKNECPVVGLAGCHRRKIGKWQVRMADQAMYHQGNQSVFVGGRLWTLLPPPANEKNNRSFTSVQMFHTHTHPAKRGQKLRSRLWGEDEDDREMKVRWRWRWDESYLTGTRDGERKKEEEEPRENTNTNTPCPERANPEKAREKEKAEADGRTPRPAEGGRTDAPEPT